jgi:cyclic-di-GMP phosphodiesterase TipF (flagellum assembly factor)
MVLISGSAGVTAYLGVGLPMTESALIALAVLTTLVIYNAISTRLGVRAVVGSQLTDLSRGNADMARQVAELGRRLAAVESRMDGALERTRAVTDPLAAEIGELVTLVKQLAETVAVHESTITDIAQSVPPPPPEPAAAAASHAAADPAPAPPEPAAAPAPEVEESSEDLTRAMIQEAIEKNRIDLYLQPIVTLPQRKVRYYEAMSRLRTDKGDVLQASDFIGPAERAGLMPAIDNLAVFRCVQVVRRLLLKNRDIGLFCNLSVSTLTDGKIFQQLLDFLDANRAIAPSLILEFTQASLRAAGPIENESLSALVDRGFRFSLDNLQDLRIEPRELANRGFRFVKVPGSLLLNRSGAPTDIHPADLSDLLGRFGIDLIAEKIESEGMVVDLLDYDVRFGQGFLFSPPRPVRAEALQGVADRGDVIARESAPTTDPAPTAPSLREPGEELAVTETAKAPTAGLAQLARRI